MKYLGYRIMVHQKSIVYFIFFHLLGNNSSTHEDSIGCTDPNNHGIVTTVTSTTPNTTARQNKMMPYDMLSGNNYPVGNMFTGYGGNEHQLLERKA